MTPFSPKDFPHDAGQYPSKCCDCGEWFLGNKNRVECKECDMPPAEAIDPRQIALPLEEK